MIKIQPLFLLMFISVHFIHGQIQTTEYPKEGFERRIEDYVNNLWIIDTHEHLTLEVERLQMADKLDFTYLFSHYTGDIVSAGLSRELLIGVVFSNSFPLNERWELFKPFLTATRNTAYQRASLFAARDIYGINDINDSTYEQLSEKIREATKPGLYKKILKDKGKTELSILDLGHQRFDTAFYRHVERFDNFIYVFTMSEIKRLGKKYGIEVPSLDDFVKALRIAFEKGLEYNMVGVKSGLAYQRIIKYNNTSKRVAGAVFDKLANRQEVTQEEIKALQDFMMHRMLDLAGEHDMPVQIHTGLQAGNGNLITNSRPTHLTNLFMEHPKVKFCLLHSAYPYGGELSVLAKNFPNVYIDMCWSQVISPAYSIRFLDEWLETVPANKIMAFGGDYKVVELAYAHSVFARRVVSRVLIDKVRSGYFSENEAMYIARKILRENAMEIFKLKGHSRNPENIEALKSTGRLHDWWEIHNTTKGLIRQWKIIGPFPFSKGLDDSHPPEEEINFKKSFHGMTGEVSWKTVKTPENGYLDFLSEYSDGSAEIVAMAYAYAEIASPDDRDVTLTLGSNDGAKVWLNGKVIYNVHTGRGAISDQDFMDVRLKKGVNKLLVKVENLGANWGLFVRVIDPEGELKIVPPGN